MMTDTIAIEFPVDILESVHLSPDDIRLELALALYAQGKLSQGKARELAGSLSLLEFRQILVRRKIPVHYDIPDFEADVESIKNLEDSNVKIR